MVQEIAPYICAINNNETQNNMTQTIATTTLRNKTVVLSTTDKHGYTGAATYTNDTQAIKKFMALKSQNINCSVYQPWGSRVRFIQIF